MRVCLFTAYPSTTVLCVPPEWQRGEMRASRDHCLVGVRTGGDRIRIVRLILADAVMQDARATGFSGTFRPQG